MENIKTIGQEDNLDRLWDKGVAVLSYSLCFLSGFILSGARLFSVHVPLSTGFAAACTGIAFPVAAAGSAIGGLLRLSGAELINALVPLAGTAGIKFFFEKTEYRPKGRYALSICVFLVSFFCGGVTMFIDEPSLYSFLLCVCSSCLTASSVTFYSGTVGCILKKRSPYMLDNHSLICISVSLCSLLLGSSEISIAGFRPAGMFAAFVTIVASYLFGQTGGSISGIVMGVGSAVGGTGAALASGLGICGLLGGIFSKFGRFGCALAFSVTAGIISLIDGTAEGIAVFAQTAVAAMIFILIPGKKLANVKSRIREPGAGRIRLEFSSAGERLKNAANAISSVSRCISSVSQGINAMAPSTDMIVCMRVKERVCSSCRLKDNFCPENGDFETITDKLSRVNKPVAFTVTGFEKDALGNEIALLSRKKVQQACEAEYVSSLRAGDVIDAGVTHIEGFGVFCDIGAGINALMPIDSISVSRIPHPSSRFSPGQRIKAVVKNIDESGRITLSHRELLGTWEQNASALSVGETVPGIVRSVEKYGIFVELAPNLAGLAEYSEGVEVGSHAGVYVKSIIPSKMKIKLIIVDSFKADYPIDPPGYFITSGHIDRWIYSPTESDKVIESIF